MKRLPGGFAVFGDVQWLPGYCVLLTDDPTVTRLSDLTPPKATSFLASMTILASAVERACEDVDSAFLRVNIEILGNTDPYLHAHLWPRYAWEEPNLRRKPVWLYPESNWSDPGNAAGPQHDVLRARITAYLEELS
ncbi:HIT family protein [Arthrobacter tecti]